MFIDRNLLKATDISFLNNIQRIEILAFVRNKCKLSNYDSDIFCGIKERSFKGFESNNSLKIWDGTYQKALENNSELIKTLTRSVENSLLIYPGIFREEIENQIKNIRDDL